MHQSKASRGTSTTICGVLGAELVPGLVRWPRPSQTSTSEFGGVGDSFHGGPHLPLPLSVTRCNQGVYSPSPK